mmetsp:Transcript_13473/g.23272  ORF Transcript_13473/g.23272 Transcript_13473/m.23272 type:complete len:142 (-) Transcript_13473:101-526(-)|eukprot:CAMPEP_0168586884 /NCGR_PEP_ID=MMETSP0420-20121227/4547_1 /TAXON_ID=498008 /ORGANISM="Pessonella sp." /LENGTH=141 /DNA_ID=CAMNT_0008622055 /DNA_START=36 /DNA_END=461 /DNA_ORIENTATION=+
MANIGDGVAEAYEDVRNDKTDTTWALFKYVDKKTIDLDSKGTGDVDELAEKFNDDESAFAFLRVTTGDEESKRAKFVLVSWCGESVGALSRAKMSVHKASVKEKCRDFAIEKHYTEKAEISAQELIDEVTKAGGANYSANS